MIETTHLRRSVAAAATALALLAITAARAHAEVVGWGAFTPGVSISDGDTIRLTTEGGMAPAGTVEVRLLTAPGMTWRKGIEFDQAARVCSWFSCFNGFQFIAGEYLQDADHGPVSRVIPLSQARNELGFGRLRFGKAKTFGIFANDVHELNWDPAHVVSGTRFTFTWLTD